MHGIGFGQVEDALYSVTGFGQVEDALCSVTGFGQVMDALYSVTDFGQIEDTLCWACRWLQPGRGCFVLCLALAFGQVEDAGIGFMA